MSFDPGYSETLLPFDELDALLPEARAVLDDPVTKAAVYDLEQIIAVEVEVELITAAFEGVLTLDELLTDYFLKDLHRRLYGHIWTWAGRFRTHDPNLGIDWHMIQSETRSA